MSGSDAYSYNRFDAFESKLKASAEVETEETTEEEVLEEGGCGKYQEGGEVSSCDKKEDEADKKRMKKFQELQKGVDMKKKTAIKKEDLALFSAAEIEAMGLVEYKGYQEGGEVDCDKCKGKGCDHCDGKGTHKKEGKKGAKPDYLDFDGDGNKEEPMKKALKEKGGKKN